MLCAWDEQVSELLRDNHDLLQEFTLFLPENVQEEAKNRLQRNISRQNAMSARVAKRRNRDKANYRERKKRARMDETMGTLPEQERRLFQQGASAAQGELGYTGSERCMNDAADWLLILSFNSTSTICVYAFTSVRQTLSKDQWNEFLKALELFTEDILSQTELIVLVADLFMDNW